MIGMHLKDPISGTSGEVDAVAVQPDGKQIARIADDKGIEHWYFVEGLEAA